ncbi:MbtH family NRPS accessory protein [Pseudomonas asiatica]|uniref:MbtH family protein n=1 Tax=Pseudomonas monteilii TaxID=76759 RepID=A0A2N1IN04_9PSED|nr:MULTISPECIES: MbtH family NRPS accessory protein [Pseudomonas]PKI19640.1 MbtH family protein [Pseudomonas monteilii]RPD93842.1 MbtH family protein [Pseudomonas monteilii]WDM87352.1 MbtH family NRPS accessory protein [Pseudomonas asiatica]
MTTEEQDTGLYLVVINDEEQYSLWAAESPLPGGWHATGQQGNRSQCLAYIKETWTDMRPLSLRQRLQP